MEEHDDQMKICAAICRFRANPWCRIHSHHQHRAVTSFRPLLSLRASIMARTVAFLAVAAVVVAVAHASCVPSQCQFTLTPTSGSAKAFDLSSMCTGSDYTVTYKDFTCTL